MARPKRRRRNRSRLGAVVLVFGLACVAVALARWLWSPDATPHVTHAQSPAATPLPVVTAAPATTEPPEEPASSPAPAAAPAQLPSPTAEPAESPAGETPAPAAAPASGDGRPRLAIIIDDCGQWPQTEHELVELPIPLTLSVLPHVRYGPAIARAADAAGKGVMLHLPMQTLSGRYPGPGTITTAMDDGTIRAEVTNDLTELPQARGVNNHEGSRATADRRVMNDIADVLTHDDRFWIDSRTSAASVAAIVAHERGVPTASRNVFLDNVDDVGAIEAQLRVAAATARERGSAIAIGHPRVATLLAIRTLAPELTAAGIDFALASDLVR